MALIVCAHCGCEAEKASGSVNRSRAKGAPLYCGKVCAGLARRLHKSKEQRVAEKAAYDRRRRAELGEALLAEKRAAYHAAVLADPITIRAREKANRDRRKVEHLEYCRRPEYRKWKAEYDRQHRARKFFGDFSEAAIILNQLEAEIFGRATRTEIYRAKGTLNKTQERKRDYARQTGNSLRR